MISAPSQSQVTSGSTISRNSAGHGWVTNRCAMSATARSRSAHSPFMSCWLWPGGSFAAFVITWGA